MRISHKSAVGSKHKMLVGKEDPNFPFDLIFHPRKYRKKKGKGNYKSYYRYYSASCNKRNM